MNIKVITWKEFRESGDYRNNFSPATPAEIKKINGKICQLYDSNVVYNPGGETEQVWVEIEEIEQ